MNRSVSQAEISPEQIAAWLAAPLPDADSVAAVDALKAAADHHWSVDPHRSLEYAEAIIQIGQARGDTNQIALGTMARGDALKFLGKLEAAWDALDEAGHLFKAAGDDFGWARTRIGRLFISVDLKCSAEALAEAEAARAIFSAHGDTEMLLRLHLNTGVVHNYLGNYPQALALFHEALAMAETLGDAGDSYTSLLHNNIGYTHTCTGALREARRHYSQAQEIAARREETARLMLAELNLGVIALAYGHYREALLTLQRVEAAAEAHDLPQRAALARANLAGCYLRLNRFTEAWDTARKAATAYATAGAAHSQARVMRYVALAAAELGELAQARRTLDDAQQLFEAQQADVWVAYVRLLRCQIALAQGDAAAARRDIDAAAAVFTASGQEVDFAHAVLLRGEAQFQERQYMQALAAGEEALTIARRVNVPVQRYGAHLLLGRIHEAHGHRLRARRHYRAAAATADRVQRGLAITLRPDFLQDKNEAFAALIRLDLTGGAVERAFETLEQARAHVWLGYLADRDHLRWDGDDPESARLLAELSTLREEHQSYYNRVAGPDHLDEPAGQSGDLAESQQALRGRERRMRAITEQLYLRSKRLDGVATVPTLADIRQALPEGALLIAFYADAGQMWAFALDRAQITLHPLPAGPDAVADWVDKLRFNIECALADPAAAGGLAGIARRLLRRLHDALLAPLENRLAGQERAVIVPFGQLHYLPFHLLHDGTQYLIERQEVVILPAAALLAQPGTVRAGQGTRLLWHSREGQLPHTQQEAETVAALLPGDIFGEADAVRACLHAPPGQVLHVAAHGEFRIDQPDLSYIELADGQLYADDLWQADLSYALVTLSACETGSAQAVPGHELVGLGRGFLYAGAGALLVSLWRIRDDLTVRWMEIFYRALAAGANKAAAMRTAHRALLESQPGQHPALWGAFQLTGSADPLTKYMK